MIELAKPNGLSFEAVAFDSLYERSCALRKRCEQAAIEYCAEALYGFQGGQENR